MDVDIKINSKKVVESCMHNYLCIYVNFMLKFQNHQIA